MRQGAKLWIPKKRWRAVIASYNAGKNCKQIAHHYHCHEETVRTLLEQAGVPRRPRGTRYPIGARRADGRGYVLVKVAAGLGGDRWRETWRPEHVLVAEAVLKRKLRPDEHAHHKNRRRNDNRPKNIQVLTRSEHGHHHHPGPSATTIRAIKRAYRQGRHAREICRRHRISLATLYKHVTPNRHR